MKSVLNIGNFDVWQLEDIPVLSYKDFYYLALDLLQINGNHCINYYAFKTGNTLRFICCIEDERNRNKNKYFFSHEQSSNLQNEPLDALSVFIPEMGRFEDEIAASFGIKFRKISLNNQ